MKPEAQKLLDLIVELIGDGRFLPGKPETYLGYREAHVLLELEQRGGTWGRSLQVQGLNDLAHWTGETGVPAITGLIVNIADHRPGPGYFKEFNGGREDDAWWMEEVRNALIFDWSSYSTSQQLPTRTELHEYDVLYEEGKATQVQIQTRERCEALIRRAKAFYRSQEGNLLCSACGWKKPSMTLKGDVVEIHHLAPISSFPDSGTHWTAEEALKNLVPLCPNCHRIAHARQDGQLFSLSEIKDMVTR